MDTSNLKNMVVLKNLPSNIVEEAIVVLKENAKIASLELTNSENTKENGNKKNIKKEVESEKTLNKNKHNSKDYIVKEAQMLIADYISKIENKNKKENQSIQKLKSKCERLKKINFVLLFLFIASVISGFVAR